MESLVFAGTTDPDSRHNRKKYTHTSDIDAPFISSRSVSSESTSSSNASPPRVPESVLKAERELKKFLKSQPGKSDVAIDFAAKRRLIVCDDSKLKLAEHYQPQESSKCSRMTDLINPKCFHRVS